MLLAMALSFRRATIAQKLTLVVMLTTSVSLLFACGAFAAYFLEAGTDEFTESFGEFARISLAVLMVSWLLSYLLSSSLRRLVSGPIRDLAEQSGGKRWRHAADRRRSRGHFPALGSTGILSQ